MSFNFKGVEGAKATSYLKPGYYRARVTDVKAGSFEKSSIPYVEITFTTQDKLSINEKFVLKSKEPNPKFNPISRLVYLHEAWLGSNIEQDFKTPDDVAKYFKKVLVGKTAGAKTIAVGGEINGKITYGRIPLAGFVIEGEVTLGEFEEGSDEWKQFVRKSNRVTEASGKKGGLLNDDDDDDDFGDDDDNDDDDSFEEEKPAPKKTEKKTAAKKEEKKPAAKKTVKKEEPKEEEAEDEDNDGEEGGGDDDFEW